jgi:endonuclease/exonuclease/phosphatase family metal-dependent hydrolase
VRGILVLSAERGYITQLECQVDECHCPNELGGRTYFATASPELPDWMPTADHFPLLKSEGGHRTFDNIRLAHRLCNRVDYSKRIGRPYERDLARVEAARISAKSPPDSAVMWSALVWNVGMGSPSGRDSRTVWRRVQQLMEEQSIHVAMLNEVSTAVLAKIDGALFEIWGTRGLDRKLRPWCAAIVSSHGLTEIRDARGVSSRGRRPNVRFQNSRPGSWVACEVPISPKESITVVSLYGLLDELSDASVHRALSEISPVFTDPRYRTRILLGGDLNATTQWKVGPHLDADRALFERIKAYGLVDCLELDRPPGRLHDCTCTFGENCSHTMTRLDPSHPGLQVDYLFASAELAGRLDTCRTLPLDQWQDVSDHAPIIATFVGTDSNTTKS